MWNLEKLKQAAIDSRKDLVNPWSLSEAIEAAGLLRPQCMQDLNEIYELFFLFGIRHNMQNDAECLKALKRAKLGKAVGA